MMTTQHQRVRTITKPINKKQKYIAWKISYKHEHLEIIIKTKEQQRSTTEKVHRVRCATSSIKESWASENLTVHWQCSHKDHASAHSSTPEIYVRRADGQLQQASTHPHPLQHNTCICSQLRHRHAVQTSYPQSTIHTCTCRPTRTQPDLP